MEAFRFQVEKEPARHDRRNLPLPEHAAFPGRQCNVSIMSGLLPDSFNPFLDSLSLESEENTSDLLGLWSEGTAVSADGDTVAYPAERLYQPGARQK